jgi:hypothetical protein
MSNIEDEPSSERVEPGTTRHSNNSLVGLLEFGSFELLKFN